MEAMHGSGSINANPFDVFKKEIDQLTHSNVTHFFCKILSCLSNYFKRNEDEVTSLKDLAAKVKHFNGPSITAEQKKELATMIKRVASQFEEVLLNPETQKQKINDIKTLLEPQTAPVEPPQTASVEQSQTATVEPQAKSVNPLLDDTFISRFLDDTIKFATPQQPAPADDMKAMMKELSESIYGPVIPIRNPLWIIEAASKFLRKSNDPNLTDKMKIQQVIENELTKESIQPILDHPELLNEPLPNGELPLHYAMRLGKIEAIKLLLLAGSSLEKPDRNHQSALSLAISLDNPEIRACLSDYLSNYIRKQWLIQFIKKAGTNFNLENLTQQEQEQFISKISNHIKFLDFCSDKVTKIFEEQAKAKYTDELASDYQEYITFCMAATVLILNGSGYGDGSLAYYATNIGAFSQMMSFAPMLMDVVKDPHLGQFLNIGMMLARGMTDSWIGTVANGVTHALYGASIIETVKVAFCNLRTRPAAALRRFTVGAVNAGAHASKVFDNRMQMLVTGLIKNISGLPYTSTKTFIDRDECKEEHLRLFQPVFDSVSALLSPSNNQHPEAATNLAVYQGTQIGELAGLINKNCGTLPERITMPLLG